MRYHKERGLLMESVYNIWPMGQRTLPLTQKTAISNPYFSCEEVVICWNVHISSWAKVKWISWWITKSEKVGCTVPCSRWCGRRPRKLNTWVLPPAPEASSMIWNNSFKLPMSSESSMVKQLMVISHNIHVLNTPRKCQKWVWLTRVTQFAICRCGQVY